MFVLSFVETIFFGLKLGNEHSHASSASASLSNIFSLENFLLKLLNTFNEAMSRVKSNIG